MKHVSLIVFRTLALLLTVFMSMPLVAETWTVETLPMVHLQDKHRYVCNPDGILSPEVVDSLDNMLFRVEQERGVQSVIVVVREIEGGDAYRFAVDLGNKYGVGLKSQRSGLVVVLATEDRAYFIATGNGLEGTLPDAICSRVEHQLMVPKFKEADWNAGIGDGVSALARYIEGDDTLIPEPQDDDDMAEGLFFLFLFCGIFLFSVVSAYLSVVHKCPRCGKRRLVLRKEEIVRVGGRAKLHRHWRCGKCGFEKDDYNDPPAGRGNSYGRSGVPFIFGTGSGSGWGGGSFGGGGFGGGSFGGGSFGGGGAGGHF